MSGATGRKATQPTGSLPSNPSIETTRRADVFARQAGQLLGEDRWKPRSTSSAAAYSSKRPLAIASVSGVSARGSPAAYHILPEGVDLGDPERHRARSRLLLPQKRAREELGAIHDAWTRARGEALPSITTSAPHGAPRALPGPRAPTTGQGRSNPKPHSRRPSDPAQLISSCHCRRAEWSPGAAPTSVPPAASTSSEPSGRPGRAAPATLRRRPAAAVRPADP